MTVQGCQVRGRRSDGVIDNWRIYQWKKNLWPFFVWLLLGFDLVIYLFIFLFTLLVCPLPFSEANSCPFQSHGMMSQKKEAPQLSLILTFPFCGSCIDLHTLITFLRHWPSCFQNHNPLKVKRAHLLTVSFTGHRIYSWLLNPSVYLK